MINYTGVLLYKGVLDYTGVLCNAGVMLLCRCDMLDRCFGGKTGLFGWLCYTGQVYKAIQVFSYVGVLHNVFYL